MELEISEDKLKSLGMSFDELTKVMKAFGVNNNTAILQLLTKAQLAKNAEEKQNEKIKKEKLKRKEKMRPVKQCKTFFKNLVKIETIYDMRESIENDSIKTRIKDFLYNSIQPYNAFILGDKSKECFKENSISLIRFIYQLKGNDSWGLVSSCNSRGHEKFFLKSEYGILSDRNAKQYLKYILIEHMIKPIKKLALERYEEEDSKYKKDREGANDINHCYIQLSLFQLFNESSVNTIINYIVNETYDNEFAKLWQKVSWCRDELISALPIDVKHKIVQSQVCNINAFDTSSSYETDESDSDNDDIDSDYNSE